VAKLSGVELDHRLLVPTHALDASHHEQWPLDGGDARVFEQYPPWMDHRSASS
jgi:hypothetical protein